MKSYLARGREWYWAGGPGRRLLVGLLATALVSIPLGTFAPFSIPLFAMFVGWDLGAWWMDKVYVGRISRQ